MYHRAGKGNCEAHGDGNSFNMIWMMVAAKVVVLVVVRKVWVPMTDDGCDGLGWERIERA
jgi:hypothetical protein